MNGSALSYLLRTKIHNQLVSFFKKPVRLIYVVIFILLSLALSNPSLALVFNLLIMNITIPIMMIIPNPAKKEIPIKLYNRNIEKIVQ